MAKPMISLRLPLYFQMSTASLLMLHAEEEELTLLVVLMDSKIHLTSRINLVTTGKIQTVCGFASQLT